MRISRPAIAAAVCLVVLQGCVARTLVNVATAPLRAAGKAVDLATTSQSEADQKRGRELRLQEQRLGQHSRQCADGNSAACARANNELAEIERIRPPHGANGR